MTRGLRIAHLNYRSYASDRFPKIKFRYNPLSAFRKHASNNSCLVHSLGEIVFELRPKQFMINACFQGCLRGKN
jgi:hypothetical protein